MRKWRIRPHVKEELLRGNVIIWGHDDDALDEQMANDLYEELGFPGNVKMEGRPADDFHPNIKRLYISNAMELNNLDKVQQQAYNVGCDDRLDNIKFAFVQYNHYEFGIVVRVPDRRVLLT